LLVSVFFGQRYAAARRRLRHPQRRMPPATGVLGSRSLTLGAMTAAWRFDGRAGPLETGI
jgi:hypothetical protein